MFPLVPRLRLGRALAGALLATLMMKALVVALESKFVFFPSRGEGQTPASLGIRYDAVRLNTSDGETLVAWQLEPERPIADIVYFHGNGGNLSVWLPVLATLHAAGLRVLAVDYRGYGLSTGAPSEQGLYRDAAAVAAHASRSRSNETRRPLVFWGRSLGGAVAASAVRTVTPDGLILEGSFVDKAAVARTNVLLRMLNVFAAYRFNTLDMLNGFRNPVLVLHGERDSIVPVTLGRQLYEKLSAPKQFVAVAGANHNDLIGLSRRDYWTPILDFVAAAR